MIFHMSYYSDIESRYYNVMTSTILTERIKILLFLLCFTEGVVWDHHINIVVAISLADQERFDTHLLIYR